MLIFHVYVHVKPESVEPFREATIRNAQQSIQEPGIVRFDVSQRQDDPSRFVLTEIYQDETAPIAHKATAHYAEWRDTVAPMMAEPRKSVEFANVFPMDQSWS
jgi:(4S)-4-hydroxy-5-phosphonooxypentane-2,3-dione isomerase